MHFPSFLFNQVRIEGNIENNFNHYVLLFHTRPQKTISLEGKSEDSAILIPPVPERWFGD